MDEKVKVIVDLTHESDAEAIKKTDTATEKLGENAATFVNLPIPLATMKADKVDFVEKIARAQYGGVNETIAKNLAREIVNSNYRQNGNYVNLIANGDKTKALLSGYELVKTKTKPILEDFELLNQKTSGYIQVWCRKKPKGYIVKLIQFSVDPNVESSWKPGGYTRKIKKIIKNLPVGQRVWVRLAIVMDEDIVKFCDPISIIVT